MSSAPLREPWTLYGVELCSRLLLGSSRYPSPAILTAARKAAVSMAGDG